MELKKVWESDFEKAYELFKAFPQNEMGFENTAYGMDKDAFKTYLEKKEEEEKEGERSSVMRFGPLW